MGDFKFMVGLVKFLDVVGDNSTTTETECISSIDHYKFYQFSLIPAVLLTLLMASTKSRRKKLLSFLDGRPGLIFPMDTLTRSSRISYCCAFGATCFVVSQIITEGQFAIDYSGPIELKTLIVIISMFIYGIVFFPVFTSLALETAFSYALGSVYVWMFFVLEVYKVTECRLNSQGRAVLIVRALPILLCLGYLSISMPVRFCLSAHKKIYFVSDLGEDTYKETFEQIKESYQGKHVRKLLQKPEIVRPPEGIIHIVKAIVIAKISKWIYHKQSGFRYPSRMMSVMFVSGCIVYVLTVEFLSMAISNLYKVKEDFESALETAGLDDGSFITIETLYYIIHVLIVSMIVSVCVSCALSFLSILHMMSSFRTNLFALYRGDYSHIPPPYEKSAISLCTGSIKYGGFQVAYIVWAYMIVCVLLFIICIVLAVVISLLMMGITDWLVDKILRIWPGFLFGLALFIGQYLISKFVFLQDRGPHLRLDNRHFYFVFTYFMFFFNIFLGSFSCLLRIIKAMVVGIIFLPRLDNSTLPRKFEFFDPGFSLYQGYIHLEVAHTHPVVNVFIRLLASMSTSKKPRKSTNETEMYHTKLQISSEKSLEERSTNLSTRSVCSKARFNWHLIYTLLHNPTVRLYRKGFVQTMKKARKEGLKIPISDKPITDFDLLKAQEEKDKENKMHSGHGLSDGWALVATEMGSPEKKIPKEREPQNRKNPIWLTKFTKRCGVDSLTNEDSDSLESSLKNEKV